MKKIVLLSLLTTMGIFGSDNKQKYFTPETPECVFYPDPDFKIPSDSSSSSSSSSTSDLPPVSSDSTAPTKLPENIEQLQRPESVTIDLTNIQKTLEFFQKQNLSSAELRTLHDGITVMTEITDLSANEEVKRINLELMQAKQQGIATEREINAIQLELLRKKLADETAHFLTKTAKQTFESTVVGGGAAFGQTIGASAAKDLYSTVKRWFIPDKEAIMEEAVSELQLTQARAKVTNDEAVAINNKASAIARETAQLEAQIEATKELLALTIQLINARTQFQENEVASA